MSWLRTPPSIYIPDVLTVKTPYHAHCNGDYFLVEKERPNQQPLWKKSDRELWIYSTVSGRWAIAGPLVKQEGFDASSKGRIKSKERHEGVMPPLVKAWQYLYEEDSVARDWRDSDWILVGELDGETIYAKNALKSLLELEEYKDVTVQADGREWKANGGLLAAASPVFGAMLSHNMKELSLIHI